MAYCKEQVRPSSGTVVYPHMPILYVHTPRDIDRYIRDYGSNSHPELYFRVGGRFVRFWASGGAKFPKMGDSLPRTLMNHRSLHNLTPLALSSPEKSVTVQTNRKETNKISNSKRYIHTLPIGMCG